MPFPTPPKRQFTPAEKSTLLVAAMAERNYAKVRAIHLADWESDNIYKPEQMDPETLTRVMPPGVTHWGALRLRSASKFMDLLLGRVYVQNLPTLTAHDRLLRGRTSRHNRGLIAKKNIKLLRNDNRRLARRKLGKFLLGYKNKDGGSFIPISVVAQAREFISNESKMVTLNGLSNPLFTDGPPRRLEDYICLLPWHPAYKEWCELVGQEQ
jgi:hypothetical protein